MIGSITRLAAPGVFFGMAHKSVREALSRETASFAVTEKRRGLAMTVLALRAEVGTVAYRREKTASSHSVIDFATAAVSDTKVTRPRAANRLQTDIRKVGLNGSNWSGSVTCDH